MNDVNTPHKDLRRTNWQTLGQLKLQAGSISNGTIEAWLMIVLGEFRVPTDLVSRLLPSIEEAMTRVLSPDSAEAQFEYLEIVVLAPAEQTSERHTWGFFRVERGSTGTELESAKGHCVEYYLYLDSKTGNRR